jgi:hypothetical protein
VFPHDDDDLEHRVDACRATFAANRTLKRKLSASRLRLARRKVNEKGWIARWNWRAGVRLALPRGGS